MPTTSSSNPEGRLRRRAPDLAALALILLVGLAPRLAIARGYEQPLQAEERLYNRYAVPWAQGQGAEPREKAFPWHPMGSFTHRPPGYALFVGLVYRGAGVEDFRAVRLAQAWVDSLSLLMVYALGILVFGGLAGRAAGLVAALLMAQYDYLMAFVGRLLSEVPYLFLCLLFLLLALWAVRSRRPGVSLAAGYALGWANLTRPFVIFAIPGYLLWLLLAPGLPDRRRHLLAAFLGVAVAIGPVTLRNWQFHHRFMPISSNGGFTLYNSIAKVEGLTDPGFLPTEEAIDALELGELEEQATFRRAALDYMRAYPQDLPRIFARKVRVFLAAKGGHKISHELMVTPDDPWLYPASLVGALASLAVWPRRRWHARLLIWITLLSQFAVCMITNTETRYRVPMIPLLAVLAAWAVVGPLAWAWGRARAGAPRPVPS